MSRKSAHRGGAPPPPPDGGPPSPPPTAEQVEFARMLGAVLAAAWITEPCRTSPPVLHPTAPDPEPKNNRNLSPQAPTGFPG